MAQPVRGSFANPAPQLVHGSIPTQEMVVSAAHVVAPCQPQIFGRATVEHTPIVSVWRTCDGGQQVEAQRILAEGGSGVIMAGNPLDVVVKFAKPGGGDPFESTRQESENFKGCPSVIRCDGLRWFQSATGQVCPGLVLQRARFSLHDYVLLYRRSNISHAQSVGTVAHLMSNLLDLVHEMEIHGFAHLDIKPGNILYVENPHTGKGRWAFCDLGLFVRLGRSNTVKVECAGTPSFMPPELVQARERGYTNIHVRWEECMAMVVYSVGATFHNVVSRIFDGSWRSPFHEQIDHMLRRCPADRPSIQELRGWFAFVFGPPDHSTS